MTSRFLGVTLLLSALVLVGVQPSASPARAEGAEPVRVMLMGDSITHGSEGDWTWRYRLWRHLEATAGSDVDFLGPRDNLWPGNSAYVDPAFDRDHAAHAGNRLLNPLGGLDPSGLAEQYRPDVAVVLLGFNDINIDEASPDRVVEGMRDHVESLRAGSPGVDVVVGRIPNTNVAGVSAANDGLSSLAAAMDTVDERVVVAEADAGYVVGTPDRVADTNDGVHPSSRGELKIAAAVADALSDVGLGDRYPRPLPVLPLGPRVGSVLQASPQDGAADLTWASPPGTTREVLWVRDVTAGDPWRRRAEVPSSGKLTLPLRNQHTFQLRLRPAKYWTEAQDTSSNVASVRPAAPPPGVPAGVRARGVKRGARVTWRPVPAATSYVVAHRRAKAGAVWRSRTTRDTTSTIKRLRPRAYYLFRVRAVDDGTRGLWSTTVRARTTR